MENIESYHHGEAVDGYFSITGELSVTQMTTPEEKKEINNDKKK